MPKRGKGWNLLQSRKGWRLLLHGFPARIQVVGKIGKENFWWEWFGMGMSNFLIMGRGKGKKITYMGNKWEEWERIGS
jgi:hypothetical protein